MPIPSHQPSAVAVEVSIAARSANSSRMRSMAGSRNSPVKSCMFGVTTSISSPSHAPVSAPRRRTAMTSEAIVMPAKTADGRYLSRDGPIAGHAGSEARATCASQSE